MIDDKVMINNKIMINNNQLKSVVIRRGLECFYLL